jgi:hypothetical protein
MLTTARLDRSAAFVGGACEDELQTRLVHAVHALNTSSASTSRSGSDNMRGAMRMTELNASVKEFFDRYERAHTEFNVERIAALYADVFMFGDPRGIQSIKKEDFVRVLPRRKEFFKSVGLMSSKLDSLEATQLDSKYVLAKVVWRMRFESSTREPLESLNSTTYILSAVGDSFQIVFQIDHQDLMKKVQDFGLK